MTTDTTPAPSAAFGIDWDAVTAETVVLLQRLIRFDTTNPPGNEAACAGWLGTYMESQCVSTRWYFPDLEDRRRANVASRIRGTGEKPPLLLHGHLDVVPVERDRWTVDPFAGVLKDGFVWGRGAVDMKNMVAMCAMTLALFSRLELKPKREIIFAAVADEEAGGAQGAEWLVKQYPEDFRAEYAIGEMGGFSVEMGGKRFYLVQTAEKGACWFRLSASGRPGHGSVPDPSSAVVRLAKAVAALGGKRLPFRTVDASRAMISGLAKGLGGLRGALLGGLAHSFTEPLVHRLLSQIDAGNARSLSAATRNTVSPTVLRAGEKVNVIPSRAHVDCDGRVLPGCSSQQFLAEVRRLVGDDLDMEMIHQHDGVQAPVDDPVMQVFRDAILAHDPEGIVIPNLLTGFTDAAHWSRLGAKCYGFSPLRMPAGVRFRDLVHGHDERVPVAGISFGLRALFDAVYRIAM